MGGGLQLQSNPHCKNCKEFIKILKALTKLCYKLIESF